MGASRATIDSEVRPCSKCRREQPRELFGRMTGSRDGLASWCNPCRSRLEAERRARRGLKARAKPLVGDGEKQCLRCDVVKPLVDFREAKRGRLGRASYCRPCESEYRRQLTTKSGGRAYARRKTQEYRDRNRERWRFLHRCNMQRRRAIKASADTGLVTKEVLLAIYETDACHYCCRLTERVDRTCDHVIPLTRGGLHHPDNLVMACGSCNSSKGDRTPEEWRSGN